MSLDKVKKILEIDGDPKNAIFELFEAFTQHIKHFLAHAKNNHKEHQDIYKKIDTIELTPGDKGEKGDKGDFVKGDKGDKGDKGNSGKDGKSIKGDKGNEGDPGEDGEAIVGEKGDEGKEGLPPEHEWKGTAIRFKNPDGTWGEWKNLIGQQGDRGRQGVVGYGSAHDQRMKRVDLSSQCDGSNMTFIMPEAYKGESLVLHSTQFPFIFRPGVDYSTATQSFTLNSDEVGAPQSGQTLVGLYVKL